MTHTHKPIALFVSLLLAACGGGQAAPLPGVELWIELDTDGHASAAAGVGDIEIMSAEATGGASVRASYTLGKPIPPVVVVSDGCARLALFSLWMREVCAD